MGKTREVQLYIDCVIGGGPTNTPSDLLKVLTLPVHSAPHLLNVLWALHRRAVMSQNQIHLKSGPLREQFILGLKGRTDMGGVRSARPE
mgnify:CR=1 FL=1